MGLFKEIAKSTAHNSYWALATYLNLELEEVHLYRQV